MLAENEDNKIRHFRQKIKTEMKLVSREAATQQQL